MFLMPITILCISIVTNFVVGHFLSTAVVVFFLYEIIMSYCERNQKKETNHAGIKWVWHHPIKYAPPQYSGRGIINQVCHAPYPKILRLRFCLSSHHSHGLLCYSSWGRGHGGG